MFDAARVRRGGVRVKQMAQNKCVNAAMKCMKLTYIHTPTHTSPHVYMCALVCPAVVLYMHIFVICSR